MLKELNPHATIDHIHSGFIDNYKARYKYNYFTHQTYTSHIYIWYLKKSVLYQSPLLYNVLNKEIKSSNVSLFLKEKWKIVYFRPINYFILTVIDYVISLLLLVYYIKYMYFATKNCTLYIVIY